MTDPNIQCGYNEIHPEPDEFDNVTTDQSAHKEDTPEREWID